MQHIIDTVILMTSGGLPSGYAIVPECSPRYMDLLLPDSCCRSGYLQKINVPYNLDLYFILANSMPWETG